jgi:hypothetical protein
MYEKKLSNVLSKTEPNNLFHKVKKGKHRLNAQSANRRKPPANSRRLSSLYN